MWIPSHLHMHSESLDTFACDICSLVSHSSCLQREEGSGIDTHWAIPDNKSYTPKQNILSILSV